MAREPKRALRPLRVCAASIVAILVLASSAATATALPATFWGVVPQATPTLEQLQRLERGGVGTVRIPIVWTAVQPVRGGALDWSSIDPQVENATRAGIAVLPFLSGAPPWAVPSVWVPNSGHALKTPRNLPASGAAAAGWSNFVRAAVGRYGPGGSFWAEHPGLSPRPIRTWQIWNEENFEYFVARPNPAEYGKLVKLSSDAIKGVDPGARVVLGGLFARPAEAELRRKPPLAYFASDFLDQMYERTPGVKSKFQGVALHPYTGRYQRLTPYVEEVRTVLKANHDAAKGLWITELGWSSQHPSRGNSFAKGRQGQATQLKGAFNLLRRSRSRWRLQQVDWFSVDDQRGACNFCDGSGLFGAGFAPKPAWYAFTRFTGGQP
jgi:polysaccharide biosynthesis protein PslG